MPSSNRSVTPERDWAALALSGVLAVGFAALFLSPLWLNSQPAKSSGVILGEAVSEPLAIPVRIQLPDRIERIKVLPAGGTLPETLARAAGERGEDFTYASRGASIYVENFFGLQNARGGRWIVQVNGREIGDLSQIELLQGDMVFARWESSL